MDYLEGYDSAEDLSQKYGVTTKSQIVKWINQYKQFGEDGLKKKMTKLTTLSPTPNKGIVKDTWT